MEVSQRDDFNYYKYMKVVFGLGNVGSRFAGTRHNLGARTLKAWEDTAISGTRQVKLVYPTGLMNNSGADLLNQVKNLAADDDLLVLHDDIELGLGELKMTVGGSAKGHNGVRSVMKVFPDMEIIRLRLGIGRPPAEMEVRAFVLEKFKLEEMEAVKEMTGQASDLINQFLLGVGSQNNH
jgi:PTH1 family peptidyl-tRNA hydrolase